MLTCASCQATAPDDHRFCGRCGARLDPPRADAQPQGEASEAMGKTMFFGQMQQPGQAKLVLIRGDGMDGVSYMLGATDHVIGRTDGAILFPEDLLLSPRHANFVYKEHRLHLVDEGSANGIYVRIRRPMPLESSGMFLVGEQILQVESSAPDLGPQPDGEGTYFYASPRRPSRIRLVQRLRGGDVGMIFRARGESLTIGREGNDVNFPDDPFISGRHAQIEVAEDRFMVTDLGSKNGTFVRIREQLLLEHGDYVFCGQQLLRVEIS
jgi:pSer/pThr/pTyr-binding forkhead associated (FHA) protein